MVERCKVSRLEKFLPFELKTKFLRNLAKQLENVLEEMEITMDTNPTTNSPLVNAKKSKNIFKFMVTKLVLLLLLYNPSSGSCQSTFVNEKELVAVHLSVHCVGFPTEFAIFHWQENKAVFRKFKGDLGKFSFSKYRIADLRLEKSSLLSKIQDFANGDQPDEQGHFSYHNPTVRLYVTCTSDPNDPSKNFTEIFEFEGVPYELVCQEADSQGLERHELSDEAVSLLRSALEFAPIISEEWSARRYLVTVDHINPGQIEDNDWEFAIEFGNQITPTNLSFTVGNNKAVPEKPFGRIQLGNFYGNYTVDALWDPRGKSRIDTKRSP